MPRDCVSLTYVKAGAVDKINEEYRTPEIDEVHRGLHGSGPNRSVWRNTTGGRLDELVKFDQSACQERENRKNKQNSERTPFPLATWWNRASTDRKTHSRHDLSEKDGGKAKAEGE